MSMHAKFESRSDLLPYEATHNHLLAAMLPDEFEHLKPHLELLKIQQGSVLQEAGSKLHHIWFPTTASGSLQYLTEDGASMEVAGIGSEGIFGLPLFMGRTIHSDQLIVQTSGYAYRLKADLALQEFHRNKSFQRLILLYMQTMITQLSTMAVCNRYHSIEQQLCRWLLLIVGRQGDRSELVLTQEAIAGMLGVRREGVTEAAGNLKDIGLISYRRGHIKVIDSNGLEKCACECHKVIKQEFAHLLSMYEAAKKLFPK